MPPLSMGSASAQGDLQKEFSQTVAPFLKHFCLECHGTETQEAKLDLSLYSSAESVTGAHGTWKEILDRVEAGEMPPEDAESQPSDAQRKAVVDWIRKARRFEARRNAGDPGLVLARRLSNAEYNYSVRDLTGVDIRPTKTFPIDPANEAGFDNSGESLAMSPALLNKYLGAARQVVEHLVLKPDGIAFAPHPVVTVTDRDKYCVKRIVEFYQRQPTDLADYFLAAWKFRLRDQAGDSVRDEITLTSIAAASGLSAKYLKTIWEVLNSEEAFGPIARVQAMWRELPQESSKRQAAVKLCGSIRDFVNQTRQKLKSTVESPKVEGVHKGSQTFVLWRNRKYASQRRQFHGDPLQVAKDSGDKADDEDQARYERSLQTFCSVFPDAFYIAERGRDYVEDSKKQDGERGRLLSAGFHSMMGYFRDDGPLYDLILDEDKQRELDSLWQELNFVTSAPTRQYASFLWFERTDSRYMRDPVFDFARAEDKSASSEKMIKRLSKVYLQKAIDSGGQGVGIEAIETFFTEINEQIRRVEQDRVAAEPVHLRAVVSFAERAWRRSLSVAERDRLVGLYQSLRDTDGLSHEEAIQDTIVSVLMSPRFCYRLNLPAKTEGRSPLTSHELASRLSYFLWSSLPDDELLRLAESNALLQPDVLKAQTQRMLKDDRVRGLATEFGANWLDFRRFEQHNAVDRERFPSFNDDLRQAMFEEPIRFLVDLVQKDRSVLEFVDADYTFVNATMAKHYGIELSELVEADEKPDSARVAGVGPKGNPGTLRVRSPGFLVGATPATRDDSGSRDKWFRIDNAGRFQRGGLLPMSVFLTANSPGLRTSPVKRGYWVVRRLLGERIPPPPPNVPELPADESKLGELTLRQTLAKHRDHKSCAGCHDRFDSLGLVFEGFGPIGEWRKLDLGGRVVDDSATFPGGHPGKGIQDLRRYIQTHRQQEFVDNLCRKLLSYALGRSLILSDDLLVDEMRTKLKTNGFRFQSLIENIVMSSQFRNKRGDKRE